MDPTSNAFTLGNGDLRMPTQNSQLKQSLGGSSGYHNLQSPVVSSTTGPSTRYPLLPASSYPSSSTYEPGSLQMSATSQPSPSSGMGRQRYLNVGFVNIGYNPHVSTSQPPTTTHSYGAGRNLFSSPGSVNVPQAPSSMADTPASSHKSVKHLECWYWHHHKRCKFSDEECKYSHRPTGALAGEPIKIGPGPAIAGRNLHRHMNISWKDYIGDRHTQPSLPVAPASPEAVESLKLTVRKMGLKVEESISAIKDAVIELDSILRRYQEQPEGRVAVQEDLEQLHYDLNGISHRLAGASATARREVGRAGFLDLLS